MVINITGPQNERLVESVNDFTFKAFHENSWDSSETELGVRIPLLL